MSKSIIDSREQQLTELNNFTDAVNTEITDIIDHLGWSLKSVTDVVSVIVCLKTIQRSSSLRVRLACVG